MEENTKAKNLELSKFSLEKNKKSKTDRPELTCAVDKNLKLKILLDTASNGPEELIANYISLEAMKKIKEHEIKNKISLAHSCTCTRAATSTATGDFQTAACVTLFVTLQSTNQMNLVNEKLSFRIAEGLPAEIILGYNSFRDLDISGVFRDLFIRHENEKTQGSEK